MDGLMAYTPNRLDLDPLFIFSSSDTGETALPKLCAESVRIFTFTPPAMGLRIPLIAGSIDPTPSSSAPHGRSLIATHHPFARPPCVFSPAFLAHSSVHARPVGPGSRLRTPTALAGDALDPVDTRAAREQEELECAAGRLHRDDEEAELADHAREDHEREHIGHELLRALAAQHLGVDFNR